MLKLIKDNYIIFFFELALKNKNARFSRVELSKINILMND